MKLAIALVFLSLSTVGSYAETYNYTCSACIFPPTPVGDGCDVDGKTYPLRVDDTKNVLEWRGKNYSLTGCICGRTRWLREIWLARDGERDVLYILHGNEGLRSHQGQGRKCQGPMRS